MNTPVLEISGLFKQFPIGRGRTLRAVNDVDLHVGAGETLAIVGESGSGKSTIGRMALRLLKPSAGSIRFRGEEISSLPAAAVRRIRGDMQMVFQDPWSALNPRMSVAALIEEPLLLHTSLSAGERRIRVEELADQVMLPVEFLRRRPAALSGGQLQRVCIARAVATEPKLIILDEPTSALDVSVRAGILDLLERLKQRTGVALVFISHDLGTVKLISDRILVLYMGTVVECAKTDAIFSASAHPYTQALISAHLPADPRMKVQRIPLKGEISSSIGTGSNCVFARRCPVAMPRCDSEVPSLGAVGPDGHRAACFRAELAQPAPPIS